MTGLFVDIHLKVLILVQETSPGLVHGEMVRVLLGQKRAVVSMSERGLDFDHLAWNPRESWINTRIIHQTSLP